MAARCARRPDVPIPDDLIQPPRFAVDGPLLPYRRQRVCDEDIDWVFHAHDQVLSPAEVDAVAACHRTDTVPLPIPVAAALSESTPDLSLKQIRKTTDAGEVIRVDLDVRDGEFTVLVPGPVRLRPRATLLRTIARPRGDHRRGTSFEIGGRVRQTTCRPSRPRRGGWCSGDYALCPHHDGGRQDFAQPARRAALASPRSRQRRETRRWPAPQDARQIVALLER